MEEKKRADARRAHYLSISRKDDEITRLHAEREKLQRMIGRAVEDVVDLQAHVERLREALREIEALRDHCVFSTSRADHDGNEMFMEGSNTAFRQAANIASDALRPQDEEGF